MGKTASGLVDYAKAQLGRPYWWGTFGNTASESLYKQKKAQYPNYYTASDFQSQYGQRVHDCCGLIKGYRWSDTPNSAPKYSLAQDVAVNGLYAQCTKHGDIGSIPETPGVCVFMKDMSHVGVYIGNGEVIEAMGHAYGVVKTKLKGRGWAYWGMPGWIEYGEPSQSAAQTDLPDEEPGETSGNTSSAADAAPSPQGEGFTLGFRILREGCTGEDVKALQLLLKARGYQCGSYGASRDGADGEFGSGTAAKLKEYQSANGLEADGEAGPLTMGKLLGLS